MLFHPVCFTFTVDSFQLQSIAINWYQVFCRLNAKEVTSWANFEVFLSFTFPCELLNIAPFVLQGVPEHMQHQFSFIFPSVLMLQFYALHGQWKDVLPFVLHIGTGLSDKRFLRYSGSGYDNQTLCKTILKFRYIGEFIDLRDSKTRTSKWNYW